MENRHKYVTKLSEHMLHTIDKQYNLNINEDPQLYELLKGITLIHASKQYEDEFIIENALKNMKYNLNQAFDVAPHGIIQIQPLNELSIPKDFIFRSINCTYKTTQFATFHNARLINSCNINRYNQQFIELKILGEVNGKLEFRTHQDLINTIFKNKSTIQVLDFNGNMHECHKETYGNVFNNIECKYLSSFYINLQSSHQLTIYIPIKDRNIEMHKIYINCAILANQFEIDTVPCSNTIKIPDNTIPIQIHSLTDVNQNKISHKNSDVNGWYITCNNDTLFTNIKQTTSAHMTCKNETLDTSVCQSEIFLPSAEIQWIIKPQHFKNMQIMNFIDCDALSIFNNLTKLCELEYENLNIENTILENIHDNKYIIYKYGQKFHIKSLSNNYILWNLIEQEINKYHNIKIVFRGENE